MAVLFLCVLCSLSILAETPNQEEGQRLIVRSAQLFLRADQLQQESTQLIKQGNELRKLIQDHRRKMAKLPQDSTLQAPKLSIQKQVEASRVLQNKGSRLREESEKLHAQAMSLLERGFVLVYPQWTVNRSPFRVDNAYIAGFEAVSAHNTQTRSMHPKMNDLVPNPSTYQQSDMSLELIQQTKQSLPEGVDIGTFKISRNRQYFAHIELANNTEDASINTVVINRLHSWHLLLTDLHGKPIRNATIIFSGHMPGHVHGLPTQPKVTDEVSPGVYRISGVKFQMRGWWVIDLNIAKALSEKEAGTTDHVRFNLFL